MARTSSAGQGLCPQCGKNGTLTKCSKCGYLACFTCWQKFGGWSKPCPSCGTNHKPTILSWLR